MPLCVHVVDDDADVRKGLLILLETAGYPVQCHGSAEEYWEAMEARLIDTFGCLVLDIRMPGWNGLELQQHLVERKCKLPIIFLTGHGELADAVEAMRRGAFDFFVKPVDGSLLLERVGLAWERETERSTLAALRLDLRGRLARLSRREREVLALALGGMNNQIIAVSLGLSLRTVEAHRSRLLLKLDAESLQALLRKCEKSGLSASALIGELST